jgi:hypothetical protein
MLRLSPNPLRPPAPICHHLEQYRDSGEHHAGGVRVDALDLLLRRERQLEGIAKAKAEGVYKSRPASI